MLSIIGRGPTSHLCPHKAYTYHIVPKAAGNYFMGVIMENAEGLKCNDGREDREDDERQPCVRDKKAEMLKIHVPFWANLQSENSSW